LTFDAVTTFGLVLLGLDTVYQAVTPTSTLMMVQEALLHKTKQEVQTEHSTIWM
jgi:hypothetical protein